MSRAEHPTTPRRRVLAGLLPSALGLGLAAVLTACGAGQITQTDTQSAAVNGASGSVGSVTISDAQLAYPARSAGVYQPGSNAELIVTIANNGVADDTLVRVSSPAATGVEIDGSATGSKAIPGGFAVKSGIDHDDLAAAASTSAAAASSEAATSSQAPSSAAASAPGSAAPTSSAALPPGKVTILLTGLKSLNGDSLRPGLTIPITFYFAHAGQVTVAEVPIGAPAGSQPASGTNG